MTDRVESAQVEVEVRTWPETADVVVVELTQGEVIGSYQLLTPEERDAWGVGEDPLFDCQASYELRRDSSLEALSSSPEYLEVCFGKEVRLKARDDHREMIENTLSHHSLTLNDVALSRLHALDRRLREAPLEDVFDLLVEWHDRVELRQEAGFSFENATWTAKAAPPSTHLFHYFACGLESRSPHGAREEEEAYQLFQELCNPPLEGFTLGVFLRWHYYSRAEFPERPPFSLRALSNV